jgi:bacterial/archaeal transporter family-2 protein
MTSYAHSALIMLSAGIGIPVLAALNAALGQRLGSPAAAAAILFVVALVPTLIILRVSGGSLSGALSAPPHLFLAGLLVAFYVLSITWIAPHFGVGNAVFFVLVGQLLSAAVIDQFGLFGARQIPLDPIRVAGLGLMGVGVFLTQIAGRG